MIHERRHRLILGGNDEIADHDNYNGLVYIGDLDLLFRNAHPDQYEYEYLIVGPAERGTGGPDNLTNYTVFNKPAPGKTIVFADDDLPLTPYEMCLLYQALEEIE